MSKIQSDVLASQSIDTALLVSTFTAGADYEAIRINVLLSGIDGSGDYSAYLTHQKAGAGEAYKSAITTDAVGAVTNHLFASMFLSVEDTDVVKVYITGLAGDNDGSVGITTEWWNAELTATLAVSATEAAAVVAGRYPINMYYSFEQSLTSTITEDLSVATKIYAIVKDKDYQGDDEATIFWEKTAGLTVLNQAPYAGLITDASLVVTGSSEAWNIALYVKYTATSLLLDKYIGESHNIEVKALFVGSDDPVYITGGKAPIERRYLRATS